MLPWSLWKINSILGCKAISVGWKVKQLPPFCPITELILQLTLLANGFHIFCPSSTLTAWVSQVRDYQAIQDVAGKILTNLWSGWRVTKLWELGKRDVPLENIVLSNCDALIMWELRAAIKHGDIGSVVNVLAHWMVMFWGSGKMPKYAGALFYVSMDLKFQNHEASIVVGGITI